MHPYRRFLTSTALALSAACGPDAAEPGRADLPVLALSDAPTLEIGVLEGDTDYVFQDVVSAFRLGSGNVVVADFGAAEFSVYDPEGRFVRRWGGRGEGPGEFRNMVRLYPMGTDSLMALDGWTNRLSVFDTAGTFAHQIPVSDISTDTLFTMDTWLYGRFWVDGALEASRRAAVQAALDRLPPPRSDVGYRFVRVARNGDLWIREPAVDARGMRLWTIVGPRGEPSALVRIPNDFDPQTMAAGEVLGRWRGESDVNFVRAYKVGGTSTREPAPDWLTATPVPGAVESPDEEAFVTEIRGALKQMASAQEIHYSTAMTYTARLDSLSWEQPEGVKVDIVNAGPRGWAAVFTHPGLDRVCGLGYGYTVPPGWVPGQVLCGPAAGARAADAS
jgi:hypothetical protein